MVLFLMVPVLMVLVFKVTQPPYSFALFITSGVYQIGDAGAELRQATRRGLALPYD